MSSRFKNKMKSISSTREGSSSIQKSKQSLKINGFLYSSLLWDRCITLYGKKETKKMRRWLAIHFPIHLYVIYDDCLQFHRFLRANNDSDKINTPFDIPRIERSEKNYCANICSLVSSKFKASKLNIHKVERNFEKRMKAMLKLENFINNLQLQLTWQNTESL